MTVVTLRSGSPISRTRPLSCRRGSSRWGTRCPGLWTPQTSSRWVTDDDDDDDHSSLRSSLVWMSGVRAAAWAVREAARAVTARPWDRTIQVRDRYRSVQLMANMQQCFRIDSVWSQRPPSPWNWQPWHGEWLYIKVSLESFIPEVLIDSSDITIMFCDPGYWSAQRREKQESRKYQLLLCLTLLHCYWLNKSIRK